MNKIVVLDEGYLKHRAIFSFMACSEMPAQFTFMSITIACLKRIGISLEDRIFLACDYGKSWRKLEDLEYKAQRKTNREQKQDADWWKEVYKDFNDFYEKLEPMINWNFMRGMGLEADDWASIIPRFYPDTECILVSADKDWEQLCAFKNVKIFSPITKRYKYVKDPIKVLMEKIQGDISDNLLVKPRTEAEFEIRKKIVNLLELPPHLETIMKEQLMSIPRKNLYVNKLPYYTIQKRMKDLYKLED
jgi:hypothetical protein